MARASVIADRRRERKRLRRQQMIDAIKSGMSSSEVAKVFRVSLSAIYSLCSRRRLKLHKPDRRTAHLRLASADWSKQDTVLAHEFGVSRERIRQIRKSLGKPKAERHKRRTDRVPVHQWYRENASRLQGMTIKAISEQCPFPATRETVRQYCSMYGIRYYRPGQWHPTIEQWQQKCDVVNGKLDSPCWRWKEGKHPAGYGRIGSKYCHRYAYERFIGPIPERMCVMHACDDPSCVNPQHLFIGTHRDNVLDSIAKGRRPGRVLTESEEAAICEAYTAGATIVQLAERFGAGKSMIHKTLVSRGIKMRPGGFQPGWKRRSSAA